MHRYEELEKLYYKKLYIKIFSFLLFFIALFILIYFFIREREVKSTKVVYNEKNSTISSTNKKQSNLKVAEKKNKENNKSAYIRFILPEINETLEVEDRKIIKQKHKNKHFVEKVSSVNNLSSSSFKIKETKVNVQTLIKDYNSNPNYHLAILIAKLYLEHNNIKQAEKWALKANGLKPELPDSWLIFADILQRKNQIKKAIEILKVYEETYGGNESVDEKLRELQSI